MAPRFFASPFKNALATPAKKEAWYSELPVSTSSVSESADLIKTSTDYWLAQGSSAGHLVCLPYDTPGKVGHKPSTLYVSSRAITDFDVSRFDDLLAVGGEDGKISLHSLPALSDFTPSEILSSSPLSTLSHPSGKAIDTLSFHSTTSSLLLAASKTTVAIFDVESPSPVFIIESPSALWSAKWSLDGKFVSTTSKDGFLRLYDVRTDCSAPIQQVLAHGGQKCSRNVWLSGDQIFATGFSKMRDREFSLFDSRNLSSAIKSQRVDTSTAALIPVADVERGIVYLAGRGDMTLRWVEVGGPATFTEGGSPLPLMISGMALIPPSNLNLMKAEINRLVVLTTDAVVPVSIEIPRRQYIDFHSELFPPVLARAPAQDAKAWLSGADELLDLIPQDPHKKPAPVKQAPKEVAPSSVPVLKPSPAPIAQVAKSIATPPITTSTTPTTPVTPPVAAVQKLSLTNGPTKATPPTPAAPIVSASTSTPSVVKATSASPSPIPTSAAAPIAHPSTSTRFNPGWSRKFLSGKTPLKPDYHDVHGLSATISADTQMLQANKLFMFFPLSGAGGRLAVHPVASTGRLPTSIPSLVCGANIVDFELDPFDCTRVAVASDDSKIRVFKVPVGGLETDSDDVLETLHDAKMDKIGQLAFHPCARNLLLSCSDDHGNPTLRLWDTETGAVLNRVYLPKGGVSSLAWSPDGTLLGVATKTKTILVLDPRSSTPPSTSPSHDSMRPVRLAWTSPGHLVSTGFSRGAMREIILYSASSSKVSQLAKGSLDVSPGPLYPFADIDTNILLLYSRGDRSCHAYEVHPDEKTPFGRLPSFEHGTLQLGFAFLPKKQSDVKAVEILHAFRLTSSTIEVVSFSVPRARVEFFQDDVFVPTRDVEVPTLGAKEWIDGKDSPPRIVNLCPPGMTLLSQAPETAAVLSTRNKISQGPQLTESQKQAAYLERLFNAAKEDGDEEEPDRTTHRPQDDDDW